MSIEVAFSLGSNMGDKVAFIREALDLMQGCEGLEITKASSFYRTDPWGIEDQDWFVNICALGNTTLPAPVLLETTQSIERKLGREKTIRWGPRRIDIDILFYGDLDLSDERLTLPHKSIAERGFVLVPLMELETGFSLKNQTLKEAYDSLGPNDSKAIKLDLQPWRDST